MAAAGALLPLPDNSLRGLLLALAIGSALAMTVNNLPAAAFGATWLARAHPAAIIAFLIGTNIAAIPTPHGSVATMLGRSVGAEHDVTTSARAYVGFRLAIRGGWCDRRDPGLGTRDPIDPAPCSGKATCGGHAGGSPDGSWAGSGSNQCDAQSQPLRSAHRAISSRSGIPFGRRGYPIGPAGWLDCALVDHASHLAG